METVVGLSEHSDDAEKAVVALAENGVEENCIGMATRKSGLFKINKIQAGKGSRFGAEIGGLTAFLAGITALMIPGIGAVFAAGTLADALATAIGITAAGIGIGAAAGSVIGALMDWGYSREDAEFYSKGISRGGVLISIKAGPGEQEKFKEILSSAGAVDLETRRREWEEDPEKKFFEGWNQNM